MEAGSSMGPRTIFSESRNEPRRRSPHSDRRQGGTSQECVRAMGSDRNLGSGLRFSRFFIGQVSMTRFIISPNSELADIRRSPESWRRLTVALFRPVSAARLVVVAPIRRPATIRVSLAAMIFADLPRWQKSLRDIPTICSTAQSRTSVLKSSVRFNLPSVGFGTKPVSPRRWMVASTNSSLPRMPFCVS